MNITTKLKPAGKINGAKVFYGHHIVFLHERGYLPERVGRLDGNCANDDISNLYDMAYGKPITTPFAVPNCKLYKLLIKFPDITPNETLAIRVPIPHDVNEYVMRAFKKYQPFVPIGDSVVDKATGVINLRRFVIERLVAEGILCYEDGCYKLI